MFFEPNWWQLYFLSETAVRVTMLLVIPPRRSPQAAKSWLILILFLPWPGVLIYWLIGRLKLPKWRRKQFTELPRVLAEPLKLLARHGTQAESEPSGPWRASRMLARRLGYFRALKDNAAEVLTDYDEGLHRLAVDIDEAKDHIHLLFYIFAYDKATIPIIAALARAVERGVKCRVLYDAFGSSDWKKTLLPALKKAGVDAREVMPVNLFFGKGLRADLRNHRKIAIIDGIIGYTGSQNLVDAQIGPDLFHEELMVRLCGPVVGQLQFVFLSDWYLETEEALNEPSFFPEPAECGTITAQVLPSGPDYDRQNNEHLIISLCHLAEHKIVMVSPYFIPSEPLMQALQAAVLRGVEVHMFLSHKTDHLISRWAQASYYEELLDNGINVYLYQRKFLHAKHMTFDDGFAWIGSTNLDIRSFELNAEINVLFYDEGVVKQLQQVHSKYLRYCESLDLKSWSERPTVYQVGENVARLLSPLL